MMNGKFMLVLLVLLFGFACGRAEEREAVAAFKQWAHSKPDKLVYVAVGNGPIATISRVPLLEEDEGTVLIEDEIPNPGSEEFWCYPGGVHVTSIDEAAEFLRRKYRERD